MNAPGPMPPPDAPTEHQRRLAETEAARPGPDTLERDVRATAGIIRVVGVLAAWSFLSIGVVEAAVSVERHRFHVFTFIPLGVLGIAMVVFAKALSQRIHRRRR